MRNTTIDRMKGIAIFCVVCAHCGNRRSISNVDYTMDLIRHNVSMLGVPIFFFLSGYLYNNQKCFADFMKSKFRVLIPWWFWGSVVWLYEVCRKGLDYANYFEWVMGKGTYLWFMTTLLAIWIICFGIKSRKVMLVVAIISLVAGVLINNGIVKNPVEGVWLINDIRIHLPFFLCGCVAKEGVRLKGGWAKHLVALFLMFIALSVCDYRTYYGKPLFMLYAFSGMVILADLAKIVAAKKIGGFFEWIGRRSYFVYMIHMPFCGVVSNLMSRSDILLSAVFLQPVIALAGVCVAILFMERLAKRNAIVSVVCGMGK